MMVSCLLCLETNDGSLNGIQSGTTKWQELNIADTIEKHFWPLVENQSSSWICLSCWRIVKDFHKFYLHIEEVHTTHKTIKVEKKEILEYYFQETDLSIEQNVNRDSTQQAISPYNTNMLLEENTDDGVTKVKNENEVLNAEYYKDIFERYHLDSDISDGDDNYHQVPNSLEPEEEEKGWDLDLISECKNNDKFIAEHFKQLKCDLCQKPLIDFTDMQKHFANKHNQRGYVVCCRKKFSDRFHLVDHLRLHLNPNHFKCNHCGIIMSNRITIKRHILIEHLGIVYGECHQCDICDISFEEEYMLGLHKSIHLPDEEKKFPCSDCAETYDSFYPLLKHLKGVHLKKIFKTCYVCGKSIFRSKDFDGHINTHESRPHTMIYCDICGFGLATENGLKLHQKSQHPVDGKKDYQCPNCPKISPTLRAIRKHIKTMHDAPSFDKKCDICEKVFKRKSFLKEHMAAHAGTPLYACPWCPKTFYSKANMHAHRKRIHPKEWKEDKLQKYSEDFQPIIANSITK